MKLRENQIEPVTIGVEFMKTPKMKPSIIVAPTAFGKSIVIAAIAKELGEKLLVLQPSKELLEQNYNKFIALGGEASIYSASMGSKELGDVTYATIGSIINIAHQFKEMGVSKIIIDECDRYPRNKSGQLRRFVDGMKATHVLGLTATPLKLQTNMGDTGPYSKLVMLTNRSKHGVFFKYILHVSQIQDIVKLGYWTPLEYQSYDFDTGALVYNSSGAEYTSDSIARSYENQNIGNKIVKKIEEVHDRKSILVAVPTIEQATELAKKIPQAAVVHGGTPKDERRRIIEELGGNDVNFDGGYGEDSDFGFSIFQKGYVVLHNPFSVNLHLKPPSGGYRFWGSGSRLLGKKRKPQPWELDQPVKFVRPVPSPTIMYGLLKNSTEEQLMEYKIKYFLNYFMKSPRLSWPFKIINLPIKLLQYNRSVYYATKLLKKGRQLK